MEQSIPNQIIMDSFFLNEPQAEIYKIFLIKGVATLGEISLLSKKTQDDCLQIIKDLISLKLIILLPGSVSRYKVLPPYEGFLAQITKYQSNFEKNNGELLKISEKFISDLKTNIQTQIKGIQEFIQTKSEESKVFDKEKDIHVSEIEKQTNELGNVSAKLVESLGKMYLEYLKTFEDRINKIKLDVDKNFSEILAEIKEVKQKNSETLEENIGKLLVPQKDGMKKLAELLLSRLKITIEGIHAIINNLKINLVTPLSKSQEQISDHTIDFQRNIFAFLNEKTEAMDTTILELKEKVANSEALIVEALSNKTKDLNANFLKILIQINDNIEQTLNLIKNKEFEILGAFSKNIQDGLLNYIKVESESLELNKSNYKATSDGLINDLKESFGTFINDYRTLSTDLKNKFQTNIEELKKVLNELFHQLNDKVTNSIFQNVARSGKVSKELELSLTTGLKQYNETFQMELNNLMGKMNPEFQAKLNDFKKNMATLKDELVQNLDSTQKTIQQDISETQKGFPKAIESQLEIIEKESNKLDLQVKGKIIKEFEELQVELTSAKDETLNYFSNGVTEFENDSNLIKRQISGLITAQNDSLEKEVIALNESISTTFSNFIVQFENIMEQLQKRSVEASANNSTTLKDYLSQLEKNFLNKFNEKLISFKTKLNSFQSTLSGLLDKRAHYLENVKEFEIKINGVLKRHMELMERTLNLVTSNATSSMDKQVGNLKLSFDSVKSEFSNVSNKELSTFEETFKNLENQLVNTLQGKLQTSNTGLKEVEGEITKNIEESLTSYQDLKEAWNADLGKTFEKLEDTIKLPKELKDQLKPDSGEQTNLVKDLLTAIINAINPKITNIFKKYSKKYETGLSDLKTTLAELISNKDGVFVLEYANLSEDISSEFQNAVTLYKTNNSTLRDNLFKNVDAIQSAILKDIIETQKGISKVVITQIEALKKEDSNLNVQLQEYLVKEYESFNIEMNSAKAEVLDYFAKSIAQIDKDPGIVAEELAKSKDIQINSLEKEFLLLNESIKTTVNNSNVQFENIMKQLEKKLSDAPNKHQTDLKELLSALEKSFSSKLDERTAISKNKFDVFQDNIGKLLDNKINYLANIKNFESDLAADLKRHEEILRKSAKIVIDSVSTLINNEFNRFNLASDSQKNSYLQGITKEIGAFEGQTTSFVNLLNSKIQENLEISKSSLNKSSSEISKIVQNLKLQSEKANEVLGKDMTDLVNTYILNWQKRFEEVSKNLEVISDQSKIVEKSADKFQTITKATMAEKMTKLDLSTNDIQEKMKTNAKRTVDSINALIDGMKKEYEKSITTFAKQIKDMLASNQKSVDSSIELTLADIRRNISTNQDILANLILNNSKKLKTELELQQDELAKLLGELKTAMIMEVLEQAKIAVESSTQEAVTILESSEEPAKEDLSKIIAQNIDNFEVFLLNLRKNFQTISERILKDYEYKAQLISDIINHGLSSYFDDHKELVSRGSEQRTVELSQETGKIQKYLQDLKVIFGKNIKTQQINYSNLLGTISSTLTANLNQFQDKSLDPIKETIEKILNYTQNIHKENENTIDTLKLILNEIEKITPLDMEKTWSIASTESIMDYIVDMILRANKSIFLIIPNLSMLKLDYFKNIEPNVFVHIFTSIDLEKDNQLLNDFLNSKNIRIWQTDTRYSLYCVFKDGVEMIFAPSNENEKEIVGFVTEQKEYLNVFQKILGPFFETISDEKKPLKKKVQVDEPVKPQMDLKKGPPGQETPKSQKESKKTTSAEGTSKIKKESKKGSQQNNKS